MQSNSVIDDDGGSTTFLRYNVVLPITKFKISFNEA